MKHAIRPSIILALVMTIAQIPAGAQILPDNKVLQTLMEARSLKCVFPWYASADWDGDEPTARTATQREFAFNIDGIDHKRQTARLIGNAGADDLLALGGTSTLTFVEQVPAGAINVTTVYAWRDKQGRFKVVHSRHTAIGGPSPSQNYGFCQVWQ
jgi:hypothetical protein